jgi:hypothetical protein
MLWCRADEAYSSIGIRLNLCDDSVIVCSEYGDL